MKVLPGPLQFKDHTGTGAFPNLSAKGDHQGLYVGKNNTPSRGNGEYRFMDAPMLCLHV